MGGPQACHSTRLASHTTRITSIVIVSARSTDIPSLQSISGCRGGNLGRMEDALDCNTREPKLDHGPCNSLDSLTGPCGQALRFIHPRMTVRDTCGTNQLIDPLAGHTPLGRKAGDGLAITVRGDDLFVAECISIIHSSRCWGGGIHWVFSVSVFGAHCLVGWRAVSTIGHQALRLHAQKPGY